MSRQQQEPQDLGFSGTYEPVTRRAPVEAVPKPPSTAILGVKPWLIVVVAILFGGFVFGIMKLLASAGREVAAHNQSVLGQVDHAKDADAQVSAQTALIAAKTIFASGASYAGVNPA